jgi:hypothetical protein
MALKNEVAVVFSDAGGVLFDTFIKQYDRISNLLTARGYPPSHIDAAIDRCVQQQLRLRRRALFKWASSPWNILTARIRMIYWLYDQSKASGGRDENKRKECAGQIDRSGL